MLFVIRNLLELLASSILLCIILHDMVIRYKRQKQCTSLFFGLCTLMVLALTFNIGFCLNHTIVAFNFLESFFYNIYFSVIVYYVAYRLLTIMKVNKVYIITLHTLFGIIVLFQISVLIQKFMISYDICSHLWYLIVGGITIILSIILAILGVRYTKNQKQKIQGIQNPQHYKNPLAYIWLWISVNIFSQVCSFIESLYFEFKTNLQCAFSPNYTTDQIIKLIFALLSFQLGMASTVIFFRRKYQRQEQDELINGSKRRPSVNIELMQGQFNYTPQS